jgi:Tol biopolymer transport system component
VINSTRNDQAATLSSDGLSLYFSSDRTGDFDIYVTRRANTQSPWQAPVRLGAALNGSTREQNPNLSADGRSLYFSSDRAGGCGGTDLWRSSRTDVANDDSWQAPANLGCSLNTTFDEAGPDLFEDKARSTTRLYFIEQNRPDGLGDFDIYSSSLGADGTYGAGVLVSELSSASRDGRTVTRRDGLEIFFFSNRPGGSGLTDLWVATRTTTADPWSTPTNLGPSVNSASDEGTPAISADGTTMVFNSSRPDSGGLNDLYIMTRTRMQ